MDWYKFIKGGKALFTVENKNSGNRFTFKVRKLDAEDKEIYFVSVLNGPDNYANYMYMGCIFGDDFRLTKKSRVSEKALSYLAFNWLWSYIKEGGELPEGVDLHHEGRCGRCGRRLTVPESIKAGFGPECINFI